MDASTTAFAAGVAISVVSSTCNSLGMGLQRQAHLKLAALPPGAPHAYYRERKWVIGVCLMAAASLLALGNFSLLGQARASAMASLTIVSNAVMAHYMLGEPFTPVDGATTALIGAGIIVAVVFGSQGGGAPQTSLSDVLALLQRDEVYVATAVISFCFVAGELLLRAIERRGVAHTIFEARLDCFCRAFLAGLYSGLTGFLAKSVVVSIEYMAAEKSANDLRRFQIWLLGISLPCSVIMQLRHLNGGLRRFNAMDIVPIYQACVVVIGVAWGWIFYLENEYLNQLDTIMFAVGVLISVSGIVVLSYKGTLLAMLKRFSDRDSEAAALALTSASAAPAAAESSNTMEMGGVAPAAAAAPKCAVAAFLCEAAPPPASPASSTSLASLDTSVPVGDFPMPPFANVDGTMMETGDDAAMPTAAQAKAPVALPDSRDSDAPPPAPDVPARAPTPASGELRSRVVDSSPATSLGDSQ